MPLPPSLASLLMRDDELRHPVDHLPRLGRRLEASGHHPLAHLHRAEPEPVGVHRHVLEGPQGTELWTIERVVNHKVVDEETSAWLERLVRILVECADDGLGDGSRDVRHEHLKKESNSEIWGKGVCDIWEKWVVWVEK